jgi:hypothetical protein
MMARLRPANREAERAAASWLGDPLTSQQTILRFETQGGVQALFAIDAPL